MKQIHRYKPLKIYWFSDSQININVHILLMNIILLLLRITDFRILLVTIFGRLIYR